MDRRFVYGWTMTSSNDTTTGGSAESLIEQATDWLLRLEEASADPGVRNAAAAWRDADPAHAQAWRRAERAYRLIAARDSAARAAPSVAAMVRPRRPVRLWIAGVATALAACLLLAYLPSLMLQLQADVITQTAEARDVTLEDGSVIQLAPRTALSVRFSAERRSIALLDGQAFFAVAPDRDRPFDVTAGGTTVTVVGTAFEVRLSEEKLTVGVQHGAVDVRSERSSPPVAARLGAGDQLTIDRQQGGTQQTTVPPDEIASWRDHRLFVEDVTVANVIGELRRYSPGWIVLTDDSLARRQVTGLYDLRDPERALRALVAPFGGQVRNVTPILRIVSGP
jgi:transmembrane sensor